MMHQPDSATAIKALLTTVPYIRVYGSEGRGQLSSVPYGDLSIAEGVDGSIPSPVFGFI